MYNRRFVIQSKNDFSSSVNIYDTSYVYEILSSVKPLIEKVELYFCVSLFVERG